MMLSHEDSLRLHVMLKTVQAIRIDENNLVVYGLAPDAREAKVVLNPNCRTEQYLRRVREFLSGAVLGSPAGYPVHLHRWTRMGQLQDANLAELLMLGEPEAITAVSGAPSLDDELARRVWWAAPTSDHARRMLERDAVVQGQMGALLAQHLVEHLPFESEPRVIIDTVRLVLQPGLLADEAVARLWDKGAKHSAYRVGFLLARPLSLPVTCPAHVSPHAAVLAELAAIGNPIAATLTTAYTAAGQAFLQTVRAVLERPTQADAVALTLNALGECFAGARRDTVQVRDTATLLAQAQQMLSDANVCEVQVRTQLSAALLGLLACAHTSEMLIVDVLAHTSATGTVLRKKLEPITQVMLAQLQALGGDV